MSSDDRSPGTAGTGGYRKVVGREVRDVCRVSHCSEDGSTHQEVAGGATIVEVHRNHLGSRAMLHASRGPHEVVRSAQSGSRGHRNLRRPTRGLRRSSSMCGDRR
jgi:hypothetical protein